MLKKLWWFVHCPSVWDEDSRQDSPNRQAIAVWFWNQTANRETNRKHRNRTGTVHIHEPNRTGGNPSRLECEPQTRSGCKPVENRRHLPIFHSLFHGLLCPSSSGDVPCISLPHLHVQKSIWLLKRKEGKMERGERQERVTVQSLDNLGLGSKIKAWNCFHVRVFEF